MRPSDKKIENPEILRAENSGVQLVQSEEKFRLLVESVQDYAIFMLDPDGYIVSWNAGAEKIKGYRAAEVIGRHFSVFYSEEDKSRTAKVLEIAKHDGVYREEGWRIRKDGSRFWAYVVITALKDETGKLHGFGKVTRDLTGKRTAEEALRRSEEKLRLMVETVQDYAIFMLEPDGTIASWNAGAQRIKGYRADEIIGKHFSVFYPPETRPKASEVLGTARREGVYREEGWRVRKDGSRFWANVVVTALRDASGELYGFAKVTRDMTERKNAEEALKKAYTELEDRVKERTRELQSYSEELARSNADLQQFAYIASHDLQEPLRLVSTYVDLLDMESGRSLNEIQKEYLKHIQEGSIRAQQLIKELLDYSRIGAKEKQFSSVSIEEVIRHVLSLLDVSIRENAAEITHDPLPRLKADRFQLEQLFQNLIANAIKYRSGEAPKIRVSARKEGDNWLFSVTDNGIGIDPKYREQIFILFKRLHNSQKYPGTGIGLALCKKIVERHGGRIWVESAPSSGSTFFFTLPVKGKTGETR